MTPVERLDREQLETIEQFQAVTGIQATEEAIQLLEQVSWNLERAVQGVFEGLESPEATSSSSFTAEPERISVPPPRVLQPRQVPDPD